MLNLKKYTKTKPKPKPTVIFKNCSYVCVCVSLCTTVVHNTALNSSDNLPSYPPDNHHCSDDVYWRGAGETLSNQPTITRWPHPFPTDSSLGWQCWCNGETAVECTVSRMFLPWVVRRVWTGSALICGTVRIVRRSTVWTHDHRHSATSCAASQNHITPTVTYHHTLWCCLHHCKKSSTTTNKVSS